jgi:hypothetical protein
MTGAEFARIRILQPSIAQATLLGTVLRSVGLRLVRASAEFGSKLFRVSQFAMRERRVPQERLVAFFAKDAASSSRSCEAVSLQARGESISGSAMPQHRIRGSASTSFIKFSVLRAMARTFSCVWST